MSDSDLKVAGTLTCEAGDVQGIVYLIYGGVIAVPRGDGNADLLPIKTHVRQLSILTSGSRIGMFFGFLGGLTTAILQSLGKGLAKGNLVLTDGRSFRFKTEPSTLRQLKDALKELGIPVH